MSGSPNSREDIHSTFLSAFLLVHPLWQPTFMISCRRFYYFRLWGSFYFRRAQAPAVNYIRETFRVRLNTSFIPGFVPMHWELNKGAKEGSCIVYFGHAVGSHLNLDWIHGQLLWYMHESIGLISLKWNHVHESTIYMFMIWNKTFKYHFYIFIYKNMSREGYFGHFRLWLRPGCVWLLFRIVENWIWVHLELIWVDLDLAWESYGQKGLICKLFYVSGTYL
jgi:hypothetical protein